MTVLQAPDVELILDVRDLRTPPGDRDEFAALWNLIEPALNGRDLRAKGVHELVGPDGTLRLEIARIAAGTGLVTPGTRFAVVAVRERPKLHYRCKECADIGRSDYGPFICSDSSGGQEHRVCDLRRTPSHLPGMRQFRNLLVRGEVLPQERRVVPTAPQAAPSGLRRRLLP
jgi:hypothetical protein